VNRGQDATDECFLFSFSEAESDAYARIAQVRCLAFLPFIASVKSKEPFMRKLSLTYPALKAICVLMSLLSSQTFQAQQPGSTTTQPQLMAPNPRTPTPSPPPPAPNVSDIPGAANPNSVPNQALAQALLPIEPTPSPKPQDDEELKKPVAGVYILDWPQGTATPNKVQTSGTQVLRLVNVNNVLYTYQFSVTEITGADDDLSALKSAIASITGVFSAKPNAAGPNANCDLSTPLTAAQSSLKSMDGTLESFFPTQSSGKYKSVSLSDTITAWGAIRASFDKLESQVVELQKSLRACASDTALTSTAEGVISKLRDMQQKVEAVQAKVDAHHVFDLPYGLNRTSDYDISVTEYYGATRTDANPVAFHLNRGFDVLTLSGGFLLTEIQSRAYSSVTAPTAGAAGTQNVLSVSNLNSHFRPALVALLNYHDPFSWGLNRPNFGLALSAGPTFDISNGKADTSRFGVFVGVTAHLWNRLFLSPGVHVGEFADFPQGYTHAGQVIPPNSGTPQGVSRWTSRFGIAITFKTKDLSSVTGATGSNAPQNTPPATPPAGKNQTAKGQSGSK